jgi:hypothetical protein
MHETYSPCNSLHSFDFFYASKEEHKRKRHWPSNCQGLRLEQKRLEQKRLKQKRLKQKGLERARPALQANFRMSLKPHAGL